MRLCGFCRGPGVNKEHVWPDWLRKIILDSRATGGQKAFHAQIERGGSTSEFKNPNLEIKVGMPCSSCNGGWMSALENQVKPFVTTMAYRGEKTLLDAGRQLALTRWIIKTAMVYEFTASPTERKYFSDSERVAFKESFAIPSNLWIWLGRYDGVRPLHAFQQRAPTSPLSAPSLYALTFTANFLAIQVFAFRSSEGDFDQLARSTRPGRLLQQYPAPNGWISCPPEITIDDEAMDILDTRFSEKLNQLGRRSHTN